MAYMSHTVTLPFPLETLTNAIVELGLSKDGPNHLDRHPVDEVLSWAVQTNQTIQRLSLPSSPVLYDQDSPRHAGDWDPEIEELLREEEAIERSITEAHETPHFRPGD